MAITISALPTEILDKVIHLVVDGENLRSAIIPCLLINRKWRDVSLAILYGELVLFCGTPLSRFLACHDRQAITNLTRSFTFYLSQAEAPDSSTYNQVSLSNLQLIEDVIPLMTSLKSFSLKRQHCLHNVWATKSTISLLLNNLPVTCTSLELDAIPHDGDNPTHVCEDLRRLLPRMEHIHIDLEPICEAILGTRDLDESFHPISLPQIQSLHISCAGNGRSGIRGCVERHKEARPLTVGHSMVQALQQVMELPDTASAEVTILGSSPPGRGNTALCWTLLRCHMRKEAHGVRTETWAFPNSWLSGDIQNPAWYIRMRHEAYVARNRDNIIDVAGGRPWRTLITGTRLPKVLAHGKEFMPDDGLFDHKDWTKMHPRKQPSMIFNERKAGMSLIEAELQEGYEEKSVLEDTPKGFVRYGGPVWQNMRLYAEDDEPPEDWDPDGPNCAVVYPTRSPRPYTILDQRFGDIRLLDGENARADMMYLLRYQLPPSTSAAEVGYYTRGLDCLLILIRLLNSFLISLSSDNRQDAEAANPMLRLAWQNIARTESAVQDWIKVKALVLEMSKPQSVRDSKLTFEGLTFTQLMKDTFWSRKEFLLFRGFATKPEDGQYWYADKAALANQMDINTIVVDANEYQDLSFEECVVRKFDLRLIDGEWNISLCAKPYVFRVRYTRNKQHPPSFKEIENIWVPIGHFEGHDLKAAKQQALYSLVAAVFLDTDQIHAYEPMSEQIVSDLRSPATRGQPWSVEDKEDGSFMLFYVPVSELEYGDLPLDTFPEVTEHREMDFDINLE